MTKLALGTVAFGMPYGLFGGQPPERDEIRRIVKLAYRRGITWVDTAAAYGNAESILADFLPTHIQTSSKLRPHVLARASTNAERKRIVLEGVKASCQTMRLRRLDAYFLHTADDIFLPGIDEALWEVIESGYALRSGVSCYTVAQAEHALAIGATALQVSYNVFDQRFTSVIAKAKTQNVLVLARCPFLQGILTHTSKELPDHLSHIVPHMERFLATTGETSPIQAALQFSIQTSAADYVLFGVHTVEQLRQCLIAADRPIEAVLIEKLREIGASIPEGVCNPSLWSLTP